MPVPLQAPASSGHACLPRLQDLLPAPSQCSGSWQHGRRPCPRSHVDAAWQPGCRPLSQGMRTVLFHRRSDTEQKAAYFLVCHLPDRFTIHAPAESGLMQCQPPTGIPSHPDGRQGSKGNLTGLPVKPDRRYRRSPTSVRSRLETQFISTDRNTFNVLFVCAVTVCRD